MMAKKSIRRKKKNREALLCCVSDILMPLLGFFPLFFEDTDFSLTAEVERFLVIYM